MLEPGMLLSLWNYNENCQDTCLILSIEKDPTWLTEENSTRVILTSPHHNITETSLEALLKQIRNGNGAIINF